MTDNTDHESFSWEAANNIALLAIAAEAFATMGFVARVVPAAPAAVAAVVAIRTLALVVIALLARELPPRRAWPTLLVWSALTLPPLAWSFALEGREGFPWVAVFAPAVYALAAHGLAHRNRWWTLAVIVALGAACLSPLEALHPLAGQLEPVLPAWTILAAAVALVLWALEATRRPAGPRRAGVGS